jgi:hypothetical protein
LGLTIEFHVLIEIKSSEWDQSVTFLRNGKRNIPMFFYLFSYVGMLAFFESHPSVSSKAGFDLTTAELVTADDATVPPFGFVEPVGRFLHHIRKFLFRFRL